jgi:hypothetical protein
MKIIATSMRYSTYLNTTSPFKNLISSHLNYLLPSLLNRRSFALANGSDFLRPMINIDTYENEIAYRLNQARRSVMFKMEAKRDLYSIFHDLEKLKINIRNFIFLQDKATNRDKDENDSFYALVEFESTKQLQLLLDKVQYFKNIERVPSTSRLIYYQNKFDKKKVLSGQTIKHTYSIDELFDDVVVNSYEILQKKITNCSKQIEEFYELNKIDELGYRFRYFVASLVEDPFRALFKNCICLPFGSSVNRFGRRATDLDLLFSFENLIITNDDQFASVEGERERNRSKGMNGAYCFMSKRKPIEERRLAQHYFHLVEYLIKYIMAQFQWTDTISHARVPIIRFNFNLLRRPLNCDLSMSNIDISYQMTKLFWTYNQMDKRVSPIVFVVRHWAKLCSVNMPIAPGPYITSYQLTMLVLYFLLKIDPPVILPLEMISARQEIDNMNSFSHDSKLETEMPRIYIKSNLKTLNIEKRIKNKLSPEQLLELFFRFYTIFKFDQNLALTSKPQPRNESHIKKRKLFIENPFDPNINIAKNVSDKELDRFQIMCQKSIEIIEQLTKNTKSYNLIEFFEIVNLQLARKKEIKQKIQNEQS